MKKSDIKMRVTCWRQDVATMIEQMYREDKKSNYHILNRLEEVFDAMGELLDEDLDNES